MRLPEPAINIPAMPRFCTLRQLVSGIAMVMMVLCQGAAMAASCMPVAPQTDRSTAAAPCHETGGAVENNSNGNNLSHGQCQTSQASPESSKTVAGMAVDLPLLTAYAAIVPVAARCAAPHETRLHHATSPPLPIVLCRLLN